MKEITINTNSAHNSAVAAICIISCVLTGWIALILSSALVDFLHPFLWTLAMLVFGISLYLIASHQTLNSTRVNLKGYALMLFLASYGLAMAWLFLYYLGAAYILSFVFISFAGSCAAALLVLSLRLRKMNAFVMLAVLAWLSYLGYLSLAAIM